MLCFCMDGGGHAGQPSVKVKCFLIGRCSRPVEGNPIDEAGDGICDHILHALREVHGAREPCAHLYFSTRITSSQWKLTYATMLPTLFIFRVSYWYVCAGLNKQEM